MPSKISTIRGLKEGELVWHLLYGRDWIGILLKIEHETKGLASPREIGLVHMQPNTRHSYFFKNNVSTKYRISDNIGYVSLNWLFKFEGELA